MRRHLLFISFFLTSVLSAQSLSIEEIITSPELRSSTLTNVQWRPHSEDFTYTVLTSSGNELWICRTRSGKMEKFFDTSQLPLTKRKKEKRHTLPNSIWAPDGRMILLIRDNDLFLFDTNTAGNLRLTNDDAEERDPSFSPDGRKIAYLKNDNLVVFDLDTGRETSMTQQGNQNLLIGRFDWTYEEEFSIRTGFEWSPNSRYISFFQLDVTPVPLFPIVSFADFHNRVEMIRYSKVGDANAAVTIGVIDVNSGKRTWLDCTADPDSSYIPRTAWFPRSNMLAITWLNRQQNHLRLLAADIHTGSTRILIDEKSTTGWLEPERKPLFISDDQFIWLSEEDGYNHIYLHHTDEREPRQLTSGNWDVCTIVHSDSNNIFFSAYKERYTDYDFYRLAVKSGRLKKLSLRAGTHKINMSPDGTCYLDSYSNLTTPTSVSLHRADGARVAQLTKPPDRAVRLMQHVRFEYSRIPLPDRSLDALWMKPTAFDSTRTHPLIIYCYGGPGSHLVSNRWGHPRTLWHRLLIDRGYIILIINSRGAADRGRAWKHSVYRHLGDYEIQDHIDAAKWAANLPCIDPARIGIWGWSYGGYTSVMSLLKGSDVFKAGAAVAPVTDWRNYDSIYTERFMDLLDVNTSGYQSASALSLAEKLDARLLLIHGTSDDNVHVANTMQLAVKLQNAGKDFDLMVYPGKTHGLMGAATRVHLYERLYQFFMENL